VTVKFVPPLRLDVLAFVTEPETMSIRSFGEFPMGCPFTSVEVKLAVPKFVSGSTPPELEGASAIASADASFAFGSFWVVLKWPPLVVSSIVSVKRPFPSVVTDALIESPGRIARDRWLPQGA
jgi:hypothetical protein